METLISVIGRQKQKLTDTKDGRGNWRTEVGKLWISHRLTPGGKVSYVLAEEHRFNYTPEQGNRRS